VVQHFTALLLFDEPGIFGRPAGFSFSWKQKPRRSLSPVHKSSTLRPAS